MKNANTYIMAGDGITTKDMETWWINNLTSFFTPKISFVNSEDLYKWVREIAKHYGMQIHKKLWSDENGQYSFDCEKWGRPKENDDRIKTNCPFTLRYYKNYGTNWIHLKFAILEHNHKLFFPYEL